MTELVYEWPFPDRWESVEDVRNFYIDRLRPALSDFVGLQIENEGYVDFLRQLRLENRPLINIGGFSMDGIKDIFSSSGKIF